MSIAITLLTAAAGAEHHENVMLETVIFGVIALVGFAALGFVTFAYRDVANRHAPKAEAYAKSHAAELEHGSGHGH